MEGLFSIEVILQEDKRGERWVSQTGGRSWGEMVRYGSGGESALVGGPKHRLVVYRAQINSSWRLLWREI